MVWPDTEARQLPMLSRWRMTEPQTGAGERGQIQLVFLELPRYDESRPPRTMIEKWAYFFREADKLTAVPEVLAKPPFIDAFEACRIAKFTISEWDPYILAGIAIQNMRGALAVAEKRGLQRGLEHGLAEGLRQSVEMIGRVLGIELTDAKRAELANMNATELEALLTRLDERNRWT